MRARGMEEGFTLLEVVVVIVLLGILAAVALPFFTNLATQADAASASGVAGAISGANSRNYAVCSLNPNHADCVQVSNCADGVNLLETGLPPDFGITANEVSPGQTRTDCVVTSPRGGQATFTLTGT
ncbi:MAG: prepilin-type N-terminal cleavage/methylation domain-containing protein [Magnetococcales bacterium]|nr:prepilin-type N-terminal cleavage/methylation domain-containing protein [Magnetococcales bacterium]